MCDCQPMLSEAWLRLLSPGSGASHPFAFCKPATPLRRMRYRRCIRPVETFEYSSISRLRCAICEAGCSAPVLCLLSRGCEASRTVRNLSIPSGVKELYGRVELVCERVRTCTLNMGL